MEKGRFEEKPIIQEAEIASIQWHVDSLSAT